MRCLHCGKKISLLRKLKDEEFCSAAHRNAFKAQEQALALQRLQELDGRLQASLAPAADAAESKSRRRRPAPAPAAPPLAGPLAQKCLTARYFRIHPGPLQPVFGQADPNQPSWALRVMAPGFRCTPLDLAGGAALAPRAAHLVPDWQQPLPPAAASAAPGLRLNLRAEPCEAQLLEPLSLSLPASAVRSGAPPAFGLAPEPLQAPGAPVPEPVRRSQAPPLSVLFAELAGASPLRCPNPARAIAAAPLWTAGLAREMLAGGPARTRGFREAPPAAGSVRLRWASVPLPGMPAERRIPAAPPLTAAHTPQAPRSARTWLPSLDAAELSIFPPASAVSAPLPDRVHPAAALAWTALPAGIQSPGADASPAPPSLGSLPLLPVSGGAPLPGFAAPPALPVLVAPHFAAGACALPGAQAAAEPVHGLYAQGTLALAPPSPARPLAFAAAAGAVGALPPRNVRSAPFAGLGVEQVRDFVDAQPAPAPETLDPDPVRGPMDRLLPVLGGRPQQRPRPGVQRSARAERPIWYAALEAEPELRGPALDLDQPDGSGPRRLIAPRRSILSRFRLPRIPSWGSAWSHAPADLKWVSLAIPVVLLLVIYSLIPSRPIESAGKVETASGNAGSAISGRFATLHKVIMERAAISLVDDFRSGLGAWSGEGAWARTWQYDKANFVAPGALALYSPTVPMSDYSVSFLAQIDRRSLNWVVRGSDARNYVAIRIVITEPGPLPKAVVMRYPVIDGKRGSVTTLPLPLTIRADTLYKVRMEVQGDRFTTYVQDQVVDSFTEDRLPSGGIGFFSPPGDRALLRWVSVMHQYDYVGRLCALLTPYTVQAEGRRVE